MTDSFLRKTERAGALFVRAAEKLQSPLLLILRLYWGWSFFMTGKGKLLSLEKTAEFFGTLGLPFPKLNALLAGSTECIGGLLLLAGLGARLVSVPLAFTMLIAYLTADREALFGIFGEPDKFLAADPFLFLLTTLIILAFGPGAFSIDWLIARRSRQSRSQP
jgi:putative oxidoreductase